MPVPAKNDDKLLAHYADAIAGIERGEFHAEAGSAALPELPELLHLHGRLSATSAFSARRDAFLKRGNGPRKGKP